jgi:hypothetical protein
VHLDGKSQEIFGSVKSHISLKVCRCVTPQITPLLGVIMPVPQGEVPFSWYVVLRNVKN